MVKYDNLRIVEKDGFPPEPEEGCREAYACFLGEVKEGSQIQESLPMPLYYKGDGIFVDSLERHPLVPVVAWDEYYSAEAAEEEEAARAAGPMGGGQESPWNYGNPELPGEYIVKIRKATNLQTYLMKTETDFWDGRKWYFWGDRIIKWMPVPADQGGTHDCN